MALVNQTIPGFYGGVSQQSESLRLDTQVTEMINCSTTIIGGTSKRPPTSLLYNDNAFPEDAFIYAYDRGDGNEQYIICINSSSQFRIFDVVKSLWVNNWTTNSYLAIPSGYIARTSFALSTVGDTTFVANKTKVPTMSSTIDYNGDQYWENNFYYWVKRTNGDTSSANSGLRYTYYIYKNGVQQASTVNHNSTSAATTLATAIGGSAVGSVVKKVASGADKWSGADSWGNQASSSWQGKIRKIQDLPNDFGFPGAVIEITGDENTNFDNYYVKYEDSVYKETVKPGLINSINAATMPHQITVRRQADNTYIDINGGTTFFTSIEWGSRTVGDEDSASEPSFIADGDPIQDIFFYRNRLGFLAGDNVILSEAGQYYNFWPTTVTDVLDSDPIDVAVDSNQAIKLLYATPFNKELLLFGNKAQFVMSAQDVLTPKNVSVQQSTAFDIADVEPVVLGPNAYFAVEKNDYSSIREYFVQADSLSNDAADITAHCPNYIPKNITKIAGSSKNDMLFALSSEEPNTVYVYNFYWQGQEKAQSAWHKWTFDGAAIFNIEVLGSNLLLMLNRDGNIDLEAVPLEFQLDFMNTIFLDNGTEAYESKIVLTKPGFTTGNAKIDDNRGTFVLRNIKLNADYGSFYNVVSHRFTTPKRYNYNSTVGFYPDREVITSKEYTYNTIAGLVPSSSLYPSDDIVPGTNTYIMPSDNKYTVMGNVDNLGIEITNSISSGFRINTLDIAGTYIKNQRNVG